MVYCILTSIAFVMGANPIIWLQFTQNLYFLHDLMKFNLGLPFAIFIIKTTDLLPEKKTHIKQFHIINIHIWNFQRLLSNITALHTITNREHIESFTQRIYIFHLIKGRQILIGFSKFRQNIRCLAFRHQFASHVFI